MSIGIVRSILLTFVVAGALTLATDAPGLGGLAAAIAVGLLLLAVAAALHAPAAGMRRAAHPWRAIDPSRLLAESNPDAEGHARPRAPGAVVPAATR